MKKKWCSAVLLMLTVFVMTIGIGPASGAENDTSGKIIRIGYAQSDEYSSYAQQLLVLAKALEDEGSIRPGFSKKYAGVNFDERFTAGDTMKLWNDICSYNTEGAAYQFVPEAFFDMDAMPRKEYSGMVNREDVDLTFVMGTAPGVYFRENEKKNKYMVMLAADPIASGIVKNETERYDNISYALIDKTPYQRQLEAGHRMLGFHKLGIVYENSREAYEYTAVDVIRQKAGELGFEIESIHVAEPSSKTDEKRYYRQLKEAYRTLVERGIDTLYITVASIDYPGKLKELLEDSIIPNKIPTLAQDDVSPVANGALFGVSLVDYGEQAEFLVRQMDRYVKEGVAFEKLDMVCECTPKIYINYSTAEKIGFDFSFEDLQLVDTIYRDSCGRM